MEFVKKYKVLLALAVVVLLIFIAVASMFSYVNNIRNDGISKENSLIGQYSDNQNELSSYILTFNETLGIADKQSSKLNDILLEAVKGRYDNDTSLEPGTGGSMFSAISEAYPDLTATTATYAKVQDQVVSGRKAYKLQQTLLLDKIRDYNDWKKKGIVKSFVVKNILGFPSDDLVVTAGNQTFRGQAALDQISTLVLTDEAIEAYQTGTQDPLITPDTDEE